jgi:molybdenum cofactor guanylyltransferase
MLSHMAVKRQARAGFVLAGGRSTRMGPGVDKAVLDFGGQTLLDRGLAVLGAICDTVTIVADPAKFPNYPLVLADVFPGCGPLGGIHTALVHSSAELNLMLAVDMPFVSSDLAAFLFAAAENCDAIVTVPRAGKRLQPLCAVYRGGFSVVAERALRAGNYKIGATFADESTRVIEADELSAAGFDEQSFFNVNTPQDHLDAGGGSLGK